MTMNLTNDSYTILISTKTWTERYYRDKAGWLKVSTRGRKFAQQQNKSSITSCLR